MKRIIIPTDFTVESLQLVEYAILNFPDTKLDIILISGYRLPDSYWSISKFSEWEKIQKQLDDKFTISKRRILLQHSKNIGRITFELFTGVNSFAFQNFIDRLDVEDAVVPKERTLQGLNNKWFDTTRFIRKNVKNVIEVPVELSEELPQRRFSLIGFFNL